MFLFSFCFKLFPILFFSAGNSSRRIVFRTFWLLATRTFDSFLVGFNRSALRSVENSKENLCWTCSSCTGRYPFQGAGKQIYQAILQARLDFDALDWEDVSKNGQVIKISMHFFLRSYWTLIIFVFQTFVADLLKLDTKQRLTVNQALLSPWIRSRVYQSETLSQAQEIIRSIWIEETSTENNRDAWDVDKTPMNMTKNWFFTKKNIEQRKVVSLFIAFLSLNCTRQENSCCALSIVATRNHRIPKKTLSTPLNYIDLTINLLDNKSQ